MNIKVYKERYLINDSNHWGSQFENLATTLNFEFPEFIEKDGIEISTQQLNKYIVFDIEQEENQDIIVDNKYSIPYEIAKMTEVTFLIKMTEATDFEDMTNKLIWNSRKLTITLNAGLEGKTNITSEKLDAFNTAVTTLNQKTLEVDTTIKTVETKVENGEFNGKDGTDGVDGKDGESGLTPYILNNYWYIGNENTGVIAKGQDGKDGVKGADGQDGKDGTNGKDGLTPHISNGYWYIGEENTGVRAEGQDGTDGADGKDYVLTDADKIEIANDIKNNLSNDFVSQNDFNATIGDIISVLDSINGEVI